MLKWVWKKQQKSAKDRDSERFDCSVRVMSKQLPGFRAITLDVSSSGLQLETQGLLEKGQILELKLEFDREELPDFNIPAEVMWAKRDGERRSHFLAGLRFKAESDTERLNLARMSAVIETRSEADLGDLLAEANKLDPSRAAVVSRTQMEAPPAGAPVQLPTNIPDVPSRDSIVKTKAPHSVTPISAGIPTPVPQTDVPLTAAQQAAAGQPDIVEPAPVRMTHPGVLIPLQVSINGYFWRRDSGELVLHYSEGSDAHQLVFPGCQVCHDHGCGANTLVKGLYATINSERLRELQAQRDGQRLKHYRFVSDGEPILDIISQECRTGG